MQWLLIPAMFLASAGTFAQDRAFSDTVAAHVFTLVNELRAERGVAPLERDARLDGAAPDFAAYMGRTGNLDHLADGSTPAARVRLPATSTARSARTSPSNTIRGALRPRDLRKIWSTAGATRQRTTATS